MKEVKTGLLPQAEAALFARLIAGRLPAEFYSQATLDLARQLLGKTLLIRPPQQESAGNDWAGATAGVVVETEGYVGPEDPACHAYSGRTRRNAIMWGEPGRAYVYFTYGNHWMVNVVTGPEGYAAAVLVRAVQPLLGLDLMRQRRNLHLLKGGNVERHLTNGPGKLCQAMAIDGHLNGQSLLGPHIYLCETPPEMALPAFETVTTTRIGITRGVDFPWRFYIKNNPFVSRK